VPNIVLFVLFQTTMTDVIHKAILTKMLSNLKSMLLAVTSRRGPLIGIKVFINSPRLKTYLVRVVVLFLHLTTRIILVS